MVTFGYVKVVKRLPKAVFLLNGEATENLWVKLSTVKIINMHAGLTLAKLETHLISQGIFWI